MTEQQNNQKKGVGQADNLQNLKSTNDLIKVTDKSNPEDLKVPLEQIKNPPPQENTQVDLNDPQIQAEIKAGKRDNLGNINESRGMVGLVTNPEKLKQMEKEQKMKNPQTEEDLKALQEEEAKQREYQKGKEKQLMTKIRLENQGYQYKNPGGVYADDPDLKDTQQQAANQPAQSPQKVSSAENVAKAEDQQEKDQGIIEVDAAGNNNNLGNNAPQTVS